MLKRYLIDGDVKRKHGSGTIKKPVNKDWAEKVFAAYKNNPGLSLRDVAKRYEISKSEVFSLKKKHGLITYKKFKVPHRTQLASVKAKYRARKLYDNFLRKDP